MAGVRLRYVVTVSLTHTTGKFASRDDLGAQVTQALEDANPGSLQSDDGAEYDVDDWTVDDEPAR